MLQEESAEWKDPDTRVFSRSDGDKSSVFLAISLWNNEDPSPFFPSEIPKVKKQVVESTVDTEISGIAEEELLQEQVKFAELSL